MIQIDIWHLCLNDTNRHMTFVSKKYTWYQSSNNTNRWMTSMFIPYEPMKSRFRTTIITKSWPIKFVMYLGSSPRTWTNQKKESKKGIPIFVALFANALCSTCRTSNFPNVTTPLAQSHSFEASGLWKLFTSISHYCLNAHHLLHHRSLCCYYKICEMTKKLTFNYFFNNSKLKFHITTILFVTTYGT